ncbi:MAG: c-type cytochrome [Methylococcales bacterium]|nr:c-type cytochrome [Methylococcales bacterium]
MSKTKIIPIAILSIAGVLPVTTYAKSPDQIMRANCASCHGDRGEGGTSWIDPSQKAFKIAGRSTRSIKKWVREGRPPEMPSFAHQEISDDELNALADYITNLPDSFIDAPKEDHVVTIGDEDPWYFPMQLDVNAGDIVKFVNEGSTYHPVTQVEFVVTGGDETAGSDSGLLGVGGVYYRTFPYDPVNPDGYTVTFLCKIHPYMRGQIFVDKAIVAPTPTLRDPIALPSDNGFPGGVGEIWVEAQFQDSVSNDLNSTKVSAQDVGKDGVIQVVNASDWTITHEIEVGNNPHNIWFKKDGTSAVITNWFDNYLTEIDADTKEFVGNYVAGAAPAHITSDHAGDDFYVSIEGSNYVQVFNQRNMRLTKQISLRANDPNELEGNGPHGIWYGGDVNNGTDIVMTSNSLNNTVSFIDPAKNIKIITLPADLYPLGAGVNSTGTRAYAGNCLAGTVSVYNLEVDPIEKMTDLYIGGCPVQTPISPDNRYVVVPNSKWTTVIYAKDIVGTNIKENTIAAQFETGTAAHGAAFSDKADGNGYYAYITHKTQNYISVIDLPEDGLPSHAGDVPLNTATANPENEKVSLYGVTDTGGNGIATNPLISPWK